MIRHLFGTTVLLCLALTFVNLKGATNSHKPLTGFQAEAIAAAVAVGEVKKQLIEIEGPRSETELTPDVWKFVFWDPTAKQNGRLITVTHGAVNEIRDGFFELDKARILAYKQDEIIPHDLLKIDSDKALDIVLKSSQLQGVSLSSVTFSLSRDKDLSQIVWKIEILADNGGKESDIGYARISAVTGGIIEMKVDLGKLKKKP